ERVEVFVALWLDSKCRLIEMQTLARGTLTQTSVYPREVVRAAIDRNAANVIFAHNHPSGSIEPSHSDHRLTQSLKAALALIEVEVLDHCIVGQRWGTSDDGVAEPKNAYISARTTAAPSIYSMAQMGVL
ncbi:MAG: hypothetical protein HC938_17065, partial [Nitrospira sp.]|nr:hypothetical protein [Nitrospira sp.]